MEGDGGTSPEGAGLVGEFEPVAHAGAASLRRASIRTSASGIVPVSVSAAAAALVGGYSEAAGTVALCAWSLRVSCPRSMSATRACDTPNRWASSTCVVC